MPGMMLGAEDTSVDKLKISQTTTNNFLVRQNLQKAIQITVK